MRLLGGVSRLDDKVLSARGSILTSSSDLALESQETTEVSIFPKLAIVIPALNEAESIGHVLDEISKVFDGKDYSVVIVDGKSVDGTPDIARKNGAIVIDQRGTGYGDALLSGFVYARDKLAPSLIAMMDADMTYDPKDILVLMKPIVEEGYDLVVGNRFLRMEKGSMTRINKIGNRIISHICNIFLKIKVSDTQCGLRVFKSDLLDSIFFDTEGMPFATEMIVEAKFSGARISEAPITYRPRIGEAKLNPLRDGLRIFGTILRLMRDTQPLLFFSGMGIIIGGIGLFLGLGVFIQWLKTGSVTRMASVVLSSLLIIGAMQLFTLGLVADMIKGLRKRMN